MTPESRRRRGRLAGIARRRGGVIISAMMRLVRGTPVVRALASAIAAVLLLCGAIPLLGYPLLRLDAASYGSAIGDAHRECGGDPIPARGGCWSAAPARVIISGVDAQSGASFVVVDVTGQPATREDFVSTPPQLGVGTTLTARYWHDSIAELTLTPPGGNAAPFAMPTRDNPAYRAAQLPTAATLLVLVGVAGLLVWGRPLLDDVRRWRNRGREAEEIAATLRESGDAATRNRGLARYGMDLHDADAVELRGERSAPRQAPAAGGTGWNVRSR